MAQISGFFEVKGTGLTLHLLTILHLYSIVVVGIKLWGYGTRLSGLSEGGSLRGARSNNLNLSSPFSILLGLSPLHWSCPGEILPPPPPRRGYHPPPRCPLRATPPLR